MTPNHESESVSSVSTMSATSRMGGVVQSTRAVGSLIACSVIPPWVNGSTSNRTEGPLMDSSISMPRRPGATSLWSSLRTCHARRASDCSCRTTCHVANMIAGKDRANAAKPIQMLISMRLSLPSP